ncbi:MAG: hypothetical protein A2579_09305 [Lysobacterales bacterium RIFOXYD1_FULL_69_11]|nr:MAG: hypothetical protein A2579_09305 [Xanthomonadales bacterium RIFOXYD1_FULL_69_11]
MAPASATRAGAALPASGAGPGIAPVAGAAQWSPAASLLAQLEAGDSQRLPRVDELPADVRRQLAAVLASRLDVVRQAVGMPPGEPVRLHVAAQGGVEVAGDHYGIARFQAALESDALAVALIRYLHGTGDGMSVAAPIRDTAGGRVLPYVRGDELHPGVDPSRIPGHPHADAGRLVHALDGMRGVVWVVGVAIAALVVASLL